MRRLDDQTDTIQQADTAVSPGLAGPVFVRILHRTPRWAGYLTAAVLAAALALVIASSYRDSFSGLRDACCVSEWLINYKGGFVRRGLGGTAILWLASLSGLSPRAVVFAVLASSYALFFASLAALVLRIRNIDYLELLLAVSPFAALFPVVHHVASQRKEVLILALAGVAAATTLGRLDSIAKYLGWSLVFAVIVAIHDGSIFFLPLFVIYLRVVTPAAYPMGYRAWALLLPAAGVFFLGYIRSNTADITALCAAMDAALNGRSCLTNSAAVWLHTSALDGVRTALKGYVTSPTALLLTLLPGAAGLIPVIIALRADAATLSRAVAGLPFQRYFVWLSALSIAVLFCIAIDGNRWFYIATVLLTLMHFAARLRHTASYSRPLSFLRRL